jgi:GNAT superfamily N-acetyltransferase
VLVIRRASPGDHLAITYVLLDAHGEFKHTVGEQVYRSYLAELLDLEPRAQRGDLVVADLFGVVGTATFYPPDAARELGWPDGWAGLDAIAVSPFIRRRGVGGELLDWSVARGVQTGASALGLRTASFMTDATRMYRSFGFDHIPERCLEPWLGSQGGHPTSVYALALKPNALGALECRQAS